MNVSAWIMVALFLRSALVLGMVYMLDIVKGSRTPHYALGVGV